MSRELGPSYCPDTGRVPVELRLLIDPLDDPEDEKRSAKPPSIRCRNGLLELPVGEMGVVGDCVVEVAV